MNKYIRTKFTQNKYIILVLMIYTVLYLLVYMFSLNYNYVEGDDASTVLYHAAGRDKTIQMPYASYNSGFDYLIELVNLKTEKHIREFSIFISFISSFLMLCLLAVFLNNFFSDENIKRKSYFLILIPFIIPDFIFHGLILSSTNISFVLVLLSLILFLKFVKTNSTKFYVLSILFLGLGIPFRWSILTIMPFFLGLTFFEFLKNKKFDVSLLIKTIVHNLLGVSLGLYFIKISGYSLNEFIEIILWGKKYMEGTESPLLGYLATGSAFFTAPFVLLIFISLLNLIVENIKKKQFSKGLILLITLSISPFFILGFFPAFKFLIVLIPILLIVSFYGFKYIYANKFLRYVFIFLILFQWFVGVKLDVTNSFNGPGFEQTFKASTVKGEINVKNVDKRISINKFYLDFDGGFYMPTLEGPRPLYGYFYVLLGGKWNNIINKFTRERDDIYSKIQNDKNYLYIQDRKTAFFQCDLFKYGYKTDTKFLVDKDSRMQYRDFYKDADSIRLYVIGKNSSKPKFMKAFFKNENKPIIFRSSYSSIILNLINDESNKDIELLGPYTVSKKETPNTVE